MSASFFVSLLVTGMYYVNGISSNETQDTFTEVICCRNKTCDPNRLFQCREDFLNVIEYYDNAFQNVEALCRNYLNQFNCYFWHNYHCITENVKNIDLLTRAKESIEPKCDVEGDIQRGKCYTSNEIRDCDRYLGDGGSTREPECQKYKQFYECVERYIKSSCSKDEDLLFAFYLISKANGRALSCSYSVNYQILDDTTRLYPHYDSTCENLARQNYEECGKRQKEDAKAAEKLTRARDRHSISCCSALRYRECIREVVRKQCHRNDSLIVDLLLGVVARDRIDSCNDVDYSKCSGTRTFSNAILMVITLFKFILLSLTNRLDI
ncbi:uncharacterized protein [Centruroides vittatus]|uniref:uncharacterized protein n=1 Tax=Centruroides vittatus TaxID=120091 RepID=UPI003510515C